MRNQAKCRKCSAIIESFFEKDYVECKCGEISIEGGPGLFKSYAKDWDNFLRVDDEGNEIIIKVKEKDSESSKPMDNSNERPNTKELLETLDLMIQNMEGIPSHAMTNPVTHYDLAASLILLSSIFKSLTSGIHTEKHSVQIQ